MSNCDKGGDRGGGRGGEEAYESDISTPSSLSSLEPSQGEEEHNEGTGTPTTSISNSSSPPSHPPAPPPPPPADSQKTPTASKPSKKIPIKSQQPNLPGRSIITRRQKREMALGLAAAEAVNGGGEVGNGDMRLTRRMRKQLGLPKLRRMGGPYDRKKKSGQKDAGGGEEEWRRNGTGRVDVRGFRELRI